MPGRRAPPEEDGPAAERTRGSRTPLGSRCRARGLRRALRRCRRARAARRALPARSGRRRRPRRDSLVGTRTSVRRITRSRRAQKPPRSMSRGEAAQKTSAAFGQSWRRERGARFADWLLCGDRGEGGGVNHRIEQDAHCTNERSDEDLLVSDLVEAELDSGRTRAAPGSRRRRAAFARRRSLHEPHGHTRALRTARSRPGRRGRSLRQRGEPRARRPRRGPRRSGREPLWSRTSRRTRGARAASDGSRGSVVGGARREIGARLGFKGSALRHRDEAARDAPVADDPDDARVAPVELELPGGAQSRALRAASAKSDKEGRPPPPPSLRRGRGAHIRRLPPSSRPSARRRRPRRRRSRRGATRSPGARPFAARESPRWRARRRARRAARGSPFRWLGNASSVLEVRRPENPANELLHPVVAGNVEVERVLVEDGVGSLRRCNR